MTPVESEGVRYLLVAELPGVPMLVRNGPADVVWLDGTPRQPALMAAIAADLRGHPTRVPLAEHPSIACFHHIPTANRPPVNELGTRIVRRLGASSVLLHGPVVFAAAPDAGGLLRSLRDQEITVLHMYRPRFV